LPLNKRYRSHFEVIASILESTQYAGATSTSLMKLANTNYKQIRKYLEFLIEQGFVEVGLERNKVVYRSGSKGFEFMRHYYALQELLSVNASRRPENAINTNSLDFQPSEHRVGTLREKIVDDKILGSGK
jgi:predicted transcriptional regulator